MYAPVPVDAGGLTAAEALLGDEVVLQFVLDVEGVRGGGLILGTGVLLEKGMGQGCFSRQPIHGVKGQDTLKEVHS